MTESTPPHDPTVETSNDGLDRDLGWAIAAVSRSYRRLAMGAVQDLPAGPRGYHLLRAVADGPARSQLALARRLDVDKTVMTYLLDDLERAGLITRRADPRDRRVRHIILTSDGANALERARRRITDAESVLLSGLASSEVDAVRTLLARLARGAQSSPGRSGSDVEPECE